MKNKKNIKRPSKVNRFVTCKELKPDLFPTHSDVTLALRERDAERRDQTQELFTCVLPYDVAISSDVSGNIQQTFSNDPNNSAYWSSYYQNFDQYRVLGVRLTYEPLIIVGGSTATVRAPISVVTDYDDSASLTAYSLAETYSDHQRHYSDKRFVKISCENVSSDGWNNAITSAPTNSFWVKLFSSGNSFSTAMGRVLIEYVVQFRGRGI